MATPKNIQGDLKRIRDNEVSVSYAISYLKEFVKRKFNEIIDIQDHKFKADALVRDKDFTPRMLDYDTSTIQYSIHGALIEANVGDNPNSMTFGVGALRSHNFYAKGRKTIKNIEAYDPSRQWSIALTNITFANNNEHQIYLKVPIEEGVTSSEIIVYEGHIDPLRDEGFIIYYLGYAHGVVDGMRKISTIFDHVKASVGASSYIDLTDTSDTSYTDKDFHVPMVNESTGELDLTPTELLTGASGTFTTADSKTVTVVDGIITSIV
jgi:hypothetical protein